MPPFLSAYYGNGILTVTLNNPPASGGPTGVVVQIGNQTASLPLENWSASLPVSVHPSLATAYIQATVYATGQAASSPPIAATTANLAKANGTAVPFQVVPPTTSGQPYWVYPTQRATLRAYYLGIADPNRYIEALTASLQDVYVMLSVVTHLLGAHVIPAMTASSWSPITLDANEQNAVESIQNSVLPNLAATLQNIYTSGGSPMEAYAELVNRVGLYQQALQAYNEAVATIPNLT